MKKYTINGKQYSYIFDYKENHFLRNSFNELTRTVYGFDFGDWFKSGYWTEKYIPYSLLFEGKVVANVSVNPIDFCLFGEKKKYVQIGTVMTAPDFRGLGLSRFLMDTVMEIWRKQCDMIYLFANGSVLNFYPKFGFEAVNEYQYTKGVQSENNTFDAEKVDMDQQNSVYYIAEYDAYAVAEFSEETLYLQDYFCETEITADEVVEKMATNVIRNVALGFTPKSKTGFEMKLLQEENTTLFVWGKDGGQFQNNKIMFPVLSHA